MIYISISNRTKKILIDKDLDRDDIQILHNELQDRFHICSFDISFVGIKHIPANIIKDMYNIRSQSIITTTDKTLWHYLTQFGIKNQYSNIIPEMANNKEMIQAIGIGGSAGSIDKLIQIIKDVPFSSYISIFITIHIPSDTKSFIVEILQKITKYKVFQAKHLQEIEKGSIYLAPPDRHLTVSNKLIYLSSGEKVNFARPSIDILFKSLAYEYKKSLLTILLCGYGKDGVGSLEILSQNRSEIILENPQECEAQVMLRNAIFTKKYSNIFNMTEILDYLKNNIYVQSNVKLDSFLERIHLIYGYDFRGYEKNSISRRINLVMKNIGVTDFAEFENQVLKDNSLFDSLLTAFSINVTNFFRNPSVFKNLRNNIIPNLENYPSIRVWCAGCSKGDEPYSLAMLFNEMGLLHKTQIYATDFNEAILSQAENGLYPTSSLDEFETNYILSGGTGDFQKWFHINNDIAEIKKELKDKILFFKHNLVTDSSINEFHIVFCRNVLIYFNKDLQEEVFQTINNSMTLDSFLVLGENEQVLNNENYHKIGHGTNKIYKKVANK